MTTATAQRWHLVEAVCTVCGDEAEAVDTRVELAGGERVAVCRDCTEQLATVHKIESAAAEALLAQSRREMQAREAMLADRDAELAQVCLAQDSLSAELERLRLEAERQKEAVGKIISAAGELRP